MGGHDALFHEHIATFNRKRTEYGERKSSRFQYFALEKRFLKREKAVGSGESC